LEQQIPLVEYCPSSFLFWIPHLYNNCMSARLSQRKYLGKNIYPPGRRAGARRTGVRGAGMGGAGMGGAGVRRAGERRGRMRPSKRRPSGKPPSWRGMTVRLLVVENGHFCLNGSQAVLCVHASFRLDPKPSQGLCAFL